MCKAHLCLARGALLIAVRSAVFADTAVVCAADVSPSADWQADLCWPTYPKYIAASLCLLVQSFMFEYKVKDALLRCVGN